MQCEEKIRLLAIYKRCVADLSATLKDLLKETSSREYLVKLQAARDECDLAHTNFRKHVSEHRC